MVNLTKLTRDYIDQNAAIKTCIARGIMNYSKLARKIIAENNLEASCFNAILVAARRSSPKVATDRPEQKIKSQLNKSKINVKTKICQFVFDAHAHIEDEIDALHIVKGVKTTTVITEDEHYESIARRYEHYLLSKRRGLVRIAIIGPHPERIVGLAAYLAGLLASRGINIITAIGSYTDDIFIIEQKDLAATLSVFDV
jgi:aspartokinase